MAPKKYGKGAHDPIPADETPLHNKDGRTHVQHVVWVYPLVCTRRQFNGVDGPVHNSNGADPSYKYNDQELQAISVLSSNKSQCHNAILCFGHDIEYSL